MAADSTTGSATEGPFLGGIFVRSYERFAPRDTGKSTKRPTVSNDTGSAPGPHGTGARPEGSVWKASTREPGTPRGTPRSRGTLTKDGKAVRDRPGRAPTDTGAVPVPVPAGYRARARQP
ncbi:hypothetical protein GCM10010145_04620 [Streptomyces ruber]|uniref:Uncharacterized protein n=2 Tax=Streptomyces TaxID=1883 RepID=A0A918B998_9ACTN|nr:hypothetical protein GCM10010145_04620 [Streptomyces ruber]